MKNESARDFLTSLDDLFKTQEERAQEQKETIVEIPLSRIEPFPNHPFQVKMDGGMEKLVDKDSIACIVRNLTDDEATIAMVETNLHREYILPSEKVFAYKMKLEAMKRQAGRPTRDNSATVLQNFGGRTSREILAEESGESHEQVRKYIRLTNLIPELLHSRWNRLLPGWHRLRVSQRI